MTARSSYTVPSKHPTKKASVRQIKKFKKLIDAVVRIIAIEPAITGDGYPKGKISIRWGKDGPPEWFCKPLGRYNKDVDKSGNVLYNACRVCLCLYENGYTEWTPSKIFRERQAFLYGVSSMEAELDKLLEIDING